MTNKPTDSKILYKRMQKEAPGITRAAIAELDKLPWIVALSADVRSWVGVVVRVGVDGFVDWLADPQGVPRAPVAPFDAVPAAAARAVTLEQTVELIRVAVDTSCELVPPFAPRGSEDWLRAAVERYGREIGFAAAMVYARAAEQRGAWDARLQAQLVDSLLAGIDERTIGARVSALGWRASGSVRALAAAANPAGNQRTEDLLIMADETSRRLGKQVIAVEHGPAVIVLVGIRSGADPIALASKILPGVKSVVIGPISPGMAEAGPSVHAALAGLSALAARANVTGAVLADDLLAERAISGDQQAREALLERCYATLLASTGGLLETADAIIDAGGALESAARRIPVHVNTLRYRLDRIQELTGYNVRDPHERFAVQVALVLGRTEAIQDAL